MFMKRKENHSNTKKTDMSSSNGNGELVYVNSFHNNISITMGEKENVSNFFSSRNYRYQYQSLSENILIKYQPET